MKTICKLVLCLTAVSSSAFAGNINYLPYPATYSNDNVDALDVLVTSAQGNRFIARMEPANRGRDIYLSWDYNSGYSILPSVVKPSGSDFYTSNLLYRGGFSANGSLYTSYDKYTKKSYVYNFNTNTIKYIPDVDKIDYLRTKAISNDGKTWLAHGDYNNGNAYSRSQKDYIINRNGEISYLPIDRVSYYPTVSIRENYRTKSVNFDYSFMSSNGARVAGNLTTAFYNDSTKAHNAFVYNADTKGYSFLFENNENVKASTLRNISQNGEFSVGNVTVVENGVEKVKMFVRSDNGNEAFYDLPSVATINQYDAKNKFFISDDGKTVIGELSFGGYENNMYFIWRQSVGFVEMTQYLSALDSSFNDKKSLDFLFLSADGKRLGGMCASRVRQGGFVKDIPLCAYTIDIDDEVLNTVGDVPVPAAAWLFSSALLGLVGMRRKNLANK